MSTVFHPQMDGASERANRSVGRILQTVIQPDQSNWVDQLPMTEFAINLNISSSTGFAPFELNCGYMPTIIRGITPFENTKPGVKRFINQAINNLEMVHNTIIQSCVSHTQHANHRRRKDDPFAVSDKVYLSTENLNLPKNRSRKLMPKFIGPYKVTHSYPEESRYTLELPDKLKTRRIHPSFHVSCLCPFKKNDNKIFPKCKVHTYYGFGDAEDEEWLVDDMLTHRWEGNKVSF